MRTAVALLLGSLALLLAACGGGSPRASASASTNTSTAPPTRFSRPLATGTVGSVATSSMEVDSASSGDLKVAWTPSTTFTETVSVGGSALAVGDCLTAIGTTTTSGQSGASMTASTVTINTVNESASCTPTSAAGGSGTGGFGGGSGFGGGRGAGGGGVGGGGAGGSGGFGGSGGAPNFALAVGKVTALSASGFVVQGETRTGQVTTSVTYNSSTAFSRTVSVHASDLAAGQCVTARGASSSSGSLTATVVTLRAPGPNGCVTGFGGFGGGGTGGAG